MIETERCKLDRLVLFNWHRARRSFFHGVRAHYRDGDFEALEQFAGRATAAAWEIQSYIERLKAVNAIEKIAVHVRRLALDGSPPDGYCRFVSMRLLEVLNAPNQLGLKAQLVRGSVGSWGHYWLAVETPHWVACLDATASQFRQPSGEPMPEIYFGDVPPWYVIDEPPIRGLIECASLGNGAPGERLGDSGGL